MAIDLNAGLHILAPEPVDKRMQAATVLELADIPVKFNKMKTYVLDDDIEYIYTLSTDTWAPVTFTASSLAWGSLTGNILTQIDLMNRFDLYALVGHTHAPVPNIHTHPTSDIDDTNGVVVWNRVNEAPNFILSGSDASNQDPDATIYMLKSEFALIDPVNGYVDKAQDSLYLGGYPASDYLRSIGANSLTWMYPYQAPVGEDVILEGTMTRIQDWTTVSNKVTTDYPAPTVAGNPLWGYTTDPTWIDTDTVTINAFGLDISFATLTNITGWRYWVPSGIPGIVTLTMYNVTDFAVPFVVGTDIIATGETPDAWFDLSSLRVVAKPGSRYRVVIETTIPISTYVKEVGTLPTIHPEGGWKGFITSNLAEVVTEALTLTDDAYGVDIIYEEYTLSSDWDVVAYSESGGGSGGGSVVPYAYTHILFDVLNADTSNVEGKITWDATEKAFIGFTDVNGGQLFGRELWMRVYNNTGIPILVGKGVSVVGVDAAGVPLIGLCDASNEQSSLNFIGILVEEVAHMAYGYVSIKGFVKHLDTSGLTAGVNIYMDPANPGDFIETVPASPNWELRVGGVSKSDATEGIIYSRPLILDNLISTKEVYNGTILEQNVNTITTDAVTVDFNLKHEDLTSDIHGMFSAEFFTISGSSTVELTVGTDAVPVMNYVYIPESTKVLTKSIVGHPTDEAFILIAEVFVPSAATVNNEGVYICNPQSDTLADENNMGIISTLTHWAAHQDAAWKSGSLGSISVAEDTFAASIDVAFTEGIISQLSDEYLRAFDTSVSDSLFLWNHPTTPYKKINNLNSTDFNVDTTNTAIGDNFYNLVFHLIKSNDNADSKILVTMPKGFYTTALAAFEDTRATAEYYLPSEFKGTYFNAMRLVMENSGGTLKVVLGGTIPILGQPPSRNIKLGIGGSVGNEQVAFGNVDGNIVGSESLKFDGTVFSAPEVSVATKLTLAWGDGDTAIGALYKGTAPFMGISDSLKTYANTWLGLYAGGTWSAHNSAEGLNAGVGTWSLYGLTTGTANTGVGAVTLTSNTTGSQNTAVGTNALYYNTSGSGNTGVGKSAGVYLTTAEQNTIVGHAALQEKLGGGNLTSISNATVLGASVKGTEGSTNEIIIGQGAEGKGSNTVTLGNDSIIDTYLKGNVTIPITPIIPAHAASKGYVDSATSTLPTAGTYEFARVTSSEFPNQDLQEVSIPGDDVILGGVHALRWVSKYGYLYAIPRTTGAVSLMYRFNDLNDLTDYTTVDISVTGYGAPDELVYSPTKEKLYAVMGSADWTQSNIVVQEIDPETLTVTTVINDPAGALIGLPAFNELNGELFVGIGNYTASLYKYDLTTYLKTGTSNIPVSGAGTSCHNVLTDGTKIYVSTGWTYSDSLVSRVSPDTMIVDEQVVVPMTPIAVGGGGFTDDGVVVGDYLFLGTEVLLGGDYIVRLDKYDLATQTNLMVPTVGDGYIYAMDYDGERVWYSGSNDLFGSIDPETLQCNQYTNKFSATFNEMIISGRVVFVAGSTFPYPVADGSTYVGSHSAPSEPFLTTQLAKDGTVLSVIDLTTKIKTFNTNITIPILPVAATDATSKDYVDTAISGIGGFGDAFLGNIQEFTASNTFTANMYVKATASFGSLRVYLDSGYSAVGGIISAVDDSADWKMYLYGNTGHGVLMNIGYSNASNATITSDTSGKILINKDYFDTYAGSGDVFLAADNLFTSSGNVFRDALTVAGTTTGDDARFILTNGELEAFSIIQESGLGKDVFFKTAAVGSSFIFENSLSSTSMTIEDDGKVLGRNDQNTVEPLGSEFITRGYADNSYIEYAEFYSDLTASYDFVNARFDSSWNVEAGQSAIGGGTLTLTGMLGATNFSSAGLYEMVQGAEYLVTLNVISYTAGTLRASIGGGDQAGLINADGVWQFRATAGIGGTLIAFVGVTPFTGVIDYLAVKLVAEAGEVVNDTTPQLGGDLELNFNKIIVAKTSNEYDTEMYAGSNGGETVFSGGGSDSYNTITDRKDIIIDTAMGGGGASINQYTGGTLHNYISFQDGQATNARMKFFNDRGGYEFADKPVMLRPQWFIGNITGDTTITNQDYFGEWIKVNSATDVTITVNQIPTGNDVLSNGQTMRFIQVGVGTVTVVGGSGVTINGTAATSNIFETISLVANELEGTIITWYSEQSGSGSAGDVYLAGTNVFTAVNTFAETPVLGSNLTFSTDAGLIKGVQQIWATAADGPSLLFTTPQLTSYKSIVPESNGTLDLGGPVTDLWKDGWFSGKVYARTDQVTTPPTDDAELVTKGYADATYIGGGGTIGGSIADNQIAFGNGANAIAGEAGLTWDGSSLTTDGSIVLQGSTTSVISTVAYSPTNLSAKFNVYAASNVEYGMTLGNFGGEYSTLIYGPNQANRRISFGKVNSAGTPVLHSNITEGAYFDLDNWAFISTGSITATNFTGSSSGSNTGDQSTITGNAGSATILETARTIAGVSFNGSANISLNNNAITNGAGYTTAAGTVTSVVSSGAINHSGTTAVTISHDTGAGNKHIPTAGAASQILQYSASGTAVWYTPPWTTNAGTVTSVIAGNGMTQTGTSTVNPTLNVVGGSGLTASANSLDLGTLTANWNAGSTYHITAQGFYDGSDRRLKENIKPLDDKFVSYNFKTDKTKRTRFGVIAQDIDQVFVHEDKEGMLSVDYTSLLVKEVVALKQKNVDLETRLEILEKLVMSIL